MFIVVLSLSACAPTVPLSPDSRDAEAKEFSGSPDAATVYVYQKDTWADPVPLRVGDEIVGNLVKKSYLVASLRPGRHILFADETRSTMVTYPLELEVSAGDLYFVALSFDSGWSIFTVTLDQVSDDEGRAAIRKRKLGRLYPVGVVEAMPVYQVN